MTRIRRILCASDFSSTSRKALTAAIDMAKTNRARLTIVYAYVPMTPLVPSSTLIRRPSIDSTGRPGGGSSGTWPRW